MSSKCDQNYRKFQNILEVHMWHENKNLGQFRGENEIHDFFPF